jgi:biopolymer transport protein ExbB/TolQ
MVVSGPQTRRPNMGLALIAMAVGLLAAVYADCVYQRNLERRGL